MSALRLPTCITIFSILCNNLLGDIVLDLSQSNDLDSINQSGVNWVESGIKSRPELAPGTYKILLPSENEFLIESIGAYIDLEFKDESKISKLVLKTRPLTMEEALVVTDIFHETFGLPKEKMREWMEPFNQGGAFRGFYSNGSLINYPGMNIKLLSAYSRDTPLFIEFIFDWHERTMRARGVSPLTNNVKGLNFDMPAILASVHTESSQIEDDELNKEPTAVPVLAFESKLDSAIKESAKIAPVEIIEEAPEESTNWLPWLIGALVVIGGLAVVVRRKN